MKAKTTAYSDPKGYVPVEVNWAVACRINAMRIALGADHAGYELKEKIKQHLAASGISVEDKGTASTDSVDYPDYARRVAEEVAAQRSQFGILVCGSGIGMAIAANKVPGVRAANVTSENEAELSRQHNDANVLALGARIVDEPKALGIVNKWLAASFAGGRHQQRVQKISAIEREELRPQRPQAV
jgi:ribose 5-phosphate isomerase B